MVKLRPTGPWRIGPDSGARNQVDVIYHSDSLYSAVTSSIARLGLLEDWLEATARSASPAVCFSSCFPFQDDLNFIVPPRTFWPPSSPGLVAARVRWKSARFVPLSIVQTILGGQSLDEDHWTVDGGSGCLIPGGQPGPFRTGVRWNAAVDRMTGASERHSTGCLEFRPGAGVWTVISFSDDAAQARWLDPVKAAFRLLADSGFGGERSRGWGHSAAPEFTEGTLPEMILGTAGQEAGRTGEGQADGGTAGQPGSAASGQSPAPHWLLSLFTPAPTDAVDWARGNYTVVARGGRVESPSASGALKKHVQMIAEGSVVYAGAPLRGSAPDVAPDGFSHPVFRAGFAVSIPLPEAG